VRGIILPWTVLRRTMRPRNSRQPPARANIASAAAAPLDCLAWTRACRVAGSAAPIATISGGPSMQLRILSLAIAGAFAAVVAMPASAADAAPNPQQERMKTCNAKAADKKGDDRKAFMQNCLSNEKKTYDNKMAQCNTKSKGMKGDEHKKFMSDCMKATS
jgi:psiF repeat